MRKSILLSFLCLLCVFVTHAEFTEWTVNTWPVALKTGDQTLTGNENETPIGKNWTCSTVPSSTKFDDYVAVGSQKNLLTHFVLSSTDFPGKISSVSINASKYGTQLYDRNIDLIVKVGGKTIGSKTIKTTTSTDYLYETAGIEGTIEISFSNSTGTRLKLYTIEIGYDPDPVDPNVPASPIFYDLSGSKLSDSYTIYSKTGDEIKVSTTTSDASIEVTSVPAGAAEYYPESGKITVTKSCEISAIASKKVDGVTYKSSPSVINVTVDKSPARPVFSGISGDTHTFSSITDTDVEVTYESDASCEVLAYSLVSNTEDEEAITIKTNSNGKITFTVYKACKVVATATRVVDGETFSSSSSVTFYGPKPDAPKFYDEKSSTLSGNYTYSATDENPNFKFYVELGANTTGYTYTASNPNALVKVEEVTKDGKELISFELSSSCNVEVTAKNNFESQSSSLTVAIKKNLIFERVTDQAQIFAGGQFVIASATSGSAYSISSTPIAGSANGALSNAGDPLSFNNDGTLNVETGSNVAIFTLEQFVDNDGNAVKDAFTLKYPSGEYLRLAKENNKGFGSTSIPNSNSAKVSVTHGTSDVIKFVNSTSGRMIRYYSSGKDFRSYQSGTGSAVYLYTIPTKREKVEIAWVNNEYTYDADFGWEGDAPKLIVPEEHTAQSLGIVYSSSDDEEKVAKIDNATGEIKYVADGTCTITASIPLTNIKFEADPASFTLTTTHAGKPVFMSDTEGTTFETEEVKLLPSVLSAGYTLYVKAPEGYEVSVTRSPQGAATITYNESNTVATITAKANCRITARTKKGEQTSTRYSSFSVSAMDLAPAEISWTASQYVYDLAKKQWNNTPELVNNYDLPVIYASTNPAVATISATGKITPIAQGNTIVSAKVEGTDDYNTNTVTANIRVTDSTAPIGFDVFEMVKKGDQLRENEQFIIVSGEPLNPEASVNSYVREGGKYYAISPYRTLDSQLRDYYEAVPVEFPDGDESGERLLVSDDSNVLRLCVQFDPTDTYESYPYLFQVMNEDKDINGDGEILDNDNPNGSSGNNERINGRYIQVNREKLFSFVDLPENVEDRGTMNGSIQVLDPEVIEGYVENDYINIKRTGNTNYSGEIGEFTDKGEIIFNGTDGSKHIVRFNPTGNAYHFNVYAIGKNVEYNTTTHSVSNNTFPIRIYRLANRVEKPSITVYPEEPVPSNIAYEDDITYNNKVRVVIEQHPKTSPEATLMRQWQKEGRNPNLPDYQSFAENQVVVYVDGHKVVDENGNLIRYIDKDFNATTATRTLFAVSHLDDAYSESAQATFNFKTSAPRVAKFSDGEDGNINVRISRPSNYTKDALYYYVISESGDKPAVTFNTDGTVSSAEGTSVTVWTGNADDTTTGVITLGQGETLWVGSFKAGYEPALVEYTNNTVFPECRPMQLLRLTDKGRGILLSHFKYTDKIFDGNYDANKPLYINYRNDLINDDGSVADNDHHFHYMIQRDHEYGERNDRQVWIEQISEDQFKEVFGSNYINVDDKHSKNFLWTSDYYVFAVNLEEFESNFSDNVTINSVKVITPNRTYTALENEFKRRATDSDGTYVYGSEAKTVKYYGAMLENQGSLGAKMLTTQVNYTVNGKEYTTETSAETSPRIPSTFGFTYEYQYVLEEESTLKAENPEKDFVKLSVPSAIEGKPNSEALIPIHELNNHHLNLVFKFHRPNISKHILKVYDIYYTIKFNRVDETDGEPVRTLLAGSGRYLDNEEDEGKDDAVYRFRIDDVHPSSKVYPELEISQITFVGNSNNENYSQYNANFGDQKTTGPAPNNSERKPLSISELWISKTPNRKLDDGRVVADWMYLGHKDMEDTPDIVVNNPNTAGPEKMITISSSFYHIETYIPDTDYYSSYEYLVKHDDEAHINPDDDSHPFFTDDVLGQPAGHSYDALRYTIIARDFPCNDDKDHTAITPKVVISPVYFFSYAADMKPLSIDEDDNKIGEYYKEGKAHITYVNSLPGAVSPTQSVRLKAPRRAASTGTEIPSSKDYPMPHAGDTDMSHESILDLTTSPEYTVVRGGEYEPTDDAPIMTGIENIANDGAAGDGKVTYYNLQGVQVANPGHGIFIRVSGGNAVKVMR